jgi:hypothetical protein
MTLTLFGVDSPWLQLLDDQPILSGKHPQHLYIAAEGAQGWHTTGQSCVYDSAHYGGYLKTPVFNGSRLAELCLIVAGGTYQPAAYKVGLAIVIWLCPWFVVGAARTAGLTPAAATLATAVSLLLLWGQPSRQTLEAGEFELLLAGMAVLAHVGLLIRFHLLPGCWVWIGLLLTGFIGWLTQPFVFPLIVPLLLVYYFSIGPKHSLAWHLALWVGELAAVGLNAFWLIDWFGYWWLRAPLPVCTSLLPHRTFRTLWQAPFWGDTGDRTLALVLLGSAAVGACLFNVRHERLQARLLGLGAAGLVILALLGIAWEPLGEVGTSTLLVPALWFAALPAAYGWTEGFAVLARCLKGTGRAILVTALLLGIGVSLHQEQVLALAERYRISVPLQIGLGPERAALVEQLALHTGPDARILWEDRPLPRTAPRWAALLPLLTGRPFVGGLDPDGTIEHSQIAFVDRSLHDRAISTWSDAALEDYCRRYNIGWIACFSPAAVARFQAWRDASATAQIEENGCGYLFTINRPRSYVLKGKAQLVHADSQRISLADIVPDNGVVVLSLHYQTGLRASLTRVQVEREPDPIDPIGFIRLRVAGPVARLTLTWEGR